MDSILDKILTQKHGEEIRAFDPCAMVTSLLRLLPEREQEVVRRRFGIPDGQIEETLEEIGARLSVTRERIRQISKTALEHLTVIGSQDSETQRFLRVAEQLLGSYAGALSDEYFINELLQFSGLVAKDETRVKAERCLRFLLNEVLYTTIHHEAGNSALKPTYALAESQKDILRAVAEELASVLATEGSPMSSEELVKRFQSSSVYAQHFELLVRQPIEVSRNFAGQDEGGMDPSEEEIHRVVLAYAAMAAELGQNIFHEWGKKNWPLIHPRRMNDKIYLVLRHEMKPLHFNDITERVNAAHFDTKVAKAPSVHNELILDQRFVLVGRGLYALKEWGFEKGTVADVIVEVLKHNSPMKREAIVSAVLDQRMVKKQTIYLALMNKNKFAKTPDGQYQLAVGAERSAHGGD